MKNQSVNQKTRDELVNDAIDVFAGGFCHTRSRTHPYLVSKVQGLWALRDAERKLDKGYRREEWVAYHRDEKEVDRIVRQHTRGSFVVCAVRTMEESTEPLRDAYKAMRYRLQGTEPFFVHDLKTIPRVTSPVEIVRVLTRELAMKLGEAQNMKPMRADELAEDAPIRQYAAVVNAKVVGWVSSIVVGERTWVSNLVVKHAFRRRGIGKALMAKMLRDDRAAGSRASVLLASHAGAMLYPLVGYRQIGEMLVLNPPRRKRIG